MGFRSPELHTSALSPSEYAAYTPIVARLLEKQSVETGSNSVSRKEFHRVLKEEWGADEDLVQAVSGSLPSYPLSQLPVGDVYATLRLLAHEQHSPTTHSASNAPTLASRDELVFVQIKPFMRDESRLPPSGAATGSQSEWSTSNHEMGISLGPLLPPPRRQASLKAPSPSKAASQTASSPNRAKASEQKTSQSTDIDGSIAVPARRQGHVKSKSTNTPSMLPPSTPLLNPFRNTRPGGSAGFVSPPPVPPKPAKVSTSQKSDLASPPPLIAIENEATSSNVDSNPFRRRQSVPEAAGQFEKTSIRDVRGNKPPLPPRQAVTQNQGEPSSQAGRGFVETASPSLPSRHAPIHATASSVGAGTVTDTRSQTFGTRLQASGPRIKNDVQPTSLLRPSRLIKEGLLAAEKARGQHHQSVRYPSPDNIVTLSHSTFGNASASHGLRASTAADSGSDRSNPVHHSKIGTLQTLKGRERSTTLSSITTAGTTSSDSSFTTKDDYHTAQASEISTIRTSSSTAESSPFADSHLIDTSLPPPPKRNVLSRLDGSTRAPKSFDIIATSEDDVRHHSAYGMGNVSRRSTLRSNRPLGGPTLDHGLAAMKDLGEDVRRAAEGVGKDLEWIRGGRGGRTLGMTLPTQEDQGGDARRGLMQNIEKDNTGSTAISDDFQQRL